MAKSYVLRVREDNEADFPRSKEMSTELHCSEMMGSVSDPGPFTEQTARGRAFLQKNGMVWQPGTLVGLSQRLLSPGDTAQEPPSPTPVLCGAPWRPLLGVSVKSAHRRAKYLSLGTAGGRAQLWKVGLQRSFVIFQEIVK